MVGLNFSVFLMMLGVGMIVALLPLRIIDLTGSGSGVGYLASAFAVSYIVLQVPIGNLSDRAGFRPFLIGGYILCGLTGLLYFFSESAGLIFLGRILQGAGEAPVWALAPALLSLKYPAEKGKVMGIYNASIHLGLTAGPVLGILLSKFFDGSQAFIFYSAVCLLGALVIYFSVDNASGGVKKEKESLNLKNITALAANGETLATLAGITLYGAGYGIFLTVIPAFLISEKSFSQDSVGVFFALFYVAVSISQIISGPLSDKLGRRLFMTAGLFIAAGCLVVFHRLDQPLISFVLALASLGLGMFYLSSMAFLNDIVPVSLKGTVSGAYYLFWGIGMFFGPVLAGNGALTLFSAALFAEAAALMLVFRKKSGPGRVMY